MRVYQVDDALFRLFEIFGVPIDNRDPAERLVRRRNVDAIGGKDDERILDAAQIGPTAVADTQESLLELVADEQVLDDGEDLLSAQEVEAVPPALEFEKPLALRVDVGEEIGVLLPDGLFRLKILEILRKPGAIKAAATKIRRQVGQPSTA